MSSAIAFYELEKSEILSPEYRQSLGAEDSFNVVATYYERLQKICPDASLLQTITFIELQLRLPELLLMRADKMSMANSIELRVPFLDRDLMDFSMRVPDEYKLRDGISKEPIKRVASKFVPREEIYRPKTGFGVPIQEWFRGKLGTRLIDMMKDESSLIIDYINISRLTARIIQGPRSVNEAFQLWMIYNVLAWEKSL
jgi:asparagine synthase (glutamine-hydrolysing)